MAFNLNMKREGLGYEVWKGLLELASNVFIEMEAFSALPLFHPLIIPHIVDMRNQTEAEDMHILSLLRDKRQPKMSWNKLNTYDEYAVQPCVILPSIINREDMKNFSALVDFMSQNDSVLPTECHHGELVFCPASLLLPHIDGVPPQYTCPSMIALCIWDTNMIRNNKEIKSEPKDESLQEIKKLMKSEPIDESFQGDSLESDLKIVDVFSYQVDDDLTKSDLIGIIPEFLNNTCQYDENKIALDCQGDTSEAPYAGVQSELDDLNFHPLTSTVGCGDSCWAHTTDTACGSHLETRDFGATFHPVKHNVMLQTMPKARDVCVQAKVLKWSQKIGPDSTITTKETSSQTSIGRSDSNLDTSKKYLSDVFRYVKQVLERAGTKEMMNVVEIIDKTYQLLISSDRRFDSKENDWMMLVSMACHLHLPKNHQNQYDLKHSKTHSNKSKKSSSDTKRQALDNVKKKQILKKAPKGAHPSQFNSKMSKNSLNVTNNKMKKSNASSTESETHNANKPNVSSQTPEVLVDNSIQGKDIKGSSIKKHFHNEQSPSINMEKYNEEELLQYLHSPIPHSILQHSKITSLMINSVEAGNHEAEDKYTKVEFKKAQQRMEQFQHNRKAEMKRLSEKRAIDGMTYSLQKAIESFKNKPPVNDSQFKGNNRFLFNTHPLCFIEPAPKIETLNIQEEPTLNGKTGEWECDKLSLKSPESFTMEIVSPEEHNSLSKDMDVTTANDGHPNPLHPLDENQSIKARNTKSSNCQGTKRKLSGDNHKDSKRFKGIETIKMRYKKKGQKINSVSSNDLKITCVENRVEEDKRVVKFKDQDYAQSTGIKDKGKIPKFDPNRRLCKYGDFNELQTDLSKDITVPKSIKYTSHLPSLEERVVFLWHKCKIWVEKSEDFGYVKYCKNSAFDYVKGLYKHRDKKGSSRLLKLTKPLCTALSAIFNRETTRLDIAHASHICSGINFDLYDISDYQEMKVKLDNRIRQMIINKDYTKKGSAKVPMDYMEILYRSQESFCNMRFEIVRTIEELEYAETLYIQKNMYPRSPSGNPPSLHGNTPFDSWHDNDFQSSSPYGHFEEDSVVDWFDDDFSKRLGFDLPPHSSSYSHERFGSKRRFDCYLERHGNDQYDASCHY